jgi:CRP-like cAMP-binding protein
LNKVKLQYVGNAPFFSALSEQEQERISERMHLEHRRSGEMLFQQDDDSIALYLIKSGWVRLIDSSGTVLASQGPGSLVGETDLFLDRARSLGATLATDAELWVLGRDDLIELLAESPQIGLQLTLAFGSRLALFDQYLVEARLKPLPYLSGLEDKTLLATARRLEPREVKEDEFVVEGGQPPEALFIVESGQVHLHSTEEGGDFSELGVGESFGEMAVLTDKPHARSAQAATDVTLWALSTADFDALAEEYPDLRMALSRSFREPLLSQDQERAVERLFTMALFKDLSEEVLWAVSQRLLLRHAPAGEQVFAKGSPGDALYLIDSGQIEIVSEEQKGYSVLARLGPDEFFGEMALLTGKPRSTAARAAAHTNLWVLYRSDFDDLVNRYPSISLALSRVLSQRLADMDRRFTESHLRGLKLLAGLSASQLEDVSGRLHPVRYRQGETIIREGDPGAEMFFIESGRVQVVRGSGSGAMLLAELVGGDLFGEMALLTGSPRSATVTALSDLDLWALSKADFDDLVTAYPNLALALSRLLSDRLRHTDERFLAKPTVTVAAPPPPVPSAEIETIQVARPAPPRQPAPQPRRVAPPKPRPQPTPKQPTRGLVGELGNVFGDMAGWFGSLSTWGKIRLVVITMLLVWMVFIIIPAIVIQTLAADNVTSLQGAIAFAEIIPPDPTETSLPTDTAVPPVAKSVAPAPVSAVEGAVPVEAPQGGQKTPTEAPTAGEGAPVEAPAGGESGSAGGESAPPGGEAASSQPTATPTPWIIVITNTPAPATDTPIPTDTPVPPTATPKPKQVAQPAAPVPTATPAGRPQPPRELDPRLGGLGVSIQPAGVKPGQQYWRLVKVRWQNKEESGNDHTIYIEVLDENGSRMAGHPVEIRWQDGSVVVQTEDKPAHEYPANFPMYATLGAYAVRVSGLPSDTIVGLGMGTAEQPDFTIHTNFLLTFQRVMR